MGPAPGWTWPPQPSLSLMGRRNLRSSHEFGGTGPWVLHVSGILISSGHLTGENCKEHPLRNTLTSLGDSRKQFPAHSRSHMGLCLQELGGVLGSRFLSPVGLKSEDFNPFLCPIKPASGALCAGHWHRAWGLLLCPEQGGRVRHRFPVLTH